MPRGWVSEISLGLRGTIQGVNHKTALTEQAFEMFPLAVQHWQVLRTPPFSLLVLGSGLKHVESPASS